MLLLWLVTAIILAVTLASATVNIQYGRQALLSMRTTASQPSELFVNKLGWLNTKIAEGKGRHGGRRRGRRGGARVRLRRRAARPPLPPVVFGNVRSVRNKMDELAACCRFQHEYRESAVIALTETWLEDKDSDSTVSIDGFHLIRSDRKDTNKRHGGGVAAYVNEKWCKQSTVRERFCSNYIEYLVISCRPFYLPREFNNVYFTIVYIPLAIDYTEATEKLSNCINKIDNECPEGIKIVLGDFNGCVFHHIIPNYTQFVECSTRENRTLDLMFCNVNNGYRVIKKPSLGNSDHNMLYCLPVYKQKLKTEECKKISLRKWSNDCSLTLQGCFDCTDFSAMYDENCEIDYNIDVFTRYIDFCVGLVVPIKEVKTFPNNKPWVTKDLKCLLNEKKVALASGNKNFIKNVQKELNVKIKDAKLMYKNKVENLFRTNKTKDAWTGLKHLCGYQTKNSMPDPDNIAEYVNELNRFYARFDDKNFSNECSDVLNNVVRVNDPPIMISEDDVFLSLKRIKTGKSEGPDNISANVLKCCSQQLIKPLHVLFQASLNQCKVPSLWKTSEIVPIPKVKQPIVMNDLRPVALTSIVMKCFEKIVKNYLCKDVDPLRDSMQFAYCKGRCVEDATTLLLHKVTQHLDTTRLNNYARVLFVDFSSAFNTIQPHIMLKKLLAMNVNSNLILWIHSYLTQRHQFVKFKNVISDIIVTNTGAPQGCVLSPLLFSLYTNDCTGEYESCSIIKYADDTVIIGKIINNNEDEYRSQVSNFVKWCDDNYLNLNVKKTKEMLIDFRKKKCTQNLVIKEEQVEIVHDYKYLGVQIDDKISGTVNTNKVYGKCMQRIHFLRILRNLKVDRTILSMFYKSVVESALCFGLSTLYGGLTVKNKNKLKKVVKIASKLGANVTSLDDLYFRNVLCTAKKIMDDNTHPLNDNYVFLRSGKRLGLPSQNTSRYKNSFVPVSIKLYNSIHSKR